MVDLEDGRRLPNPFVDFGRHLPTGGHHGEAVDGGSRGRGRGARFGGGRWGRHRADSRGSEGAPVGRQNCWETYRRRSRPRIQIAATFNSAMIATRRNVIVNTIGLAAWLLGL